MYVTQLEAPKYIPYIAERAEERFQLRESNSWETQHASWTELYTYLRTSDLIKYKVSLSTINHVMERYSM